MRNVSLKILLPLILAIWTALAICPMSLQTQGVVHQLKSGENFTMTVSLVAGQYVSAIVEQQGMDVIAVIRDPDGKVLAGANSPIGAHGPEHIHCVSDRSGPHLIELRAANAGAQPGRFSLTISEPRPAEPKHKLLITAQHAILEGEKQRASGIAAQLESAVAVFESAVADFQTTGNANGAAIALIGQGRTQHFLGRASIARECFEKAHALFEQAGNRHGEALALHRLGGAVQGTDSGKAIELYRRSLEIARELGNQFVEIRNLYGLGYLTGVRGEPEQALTMLRQAYALETSLGYRYEQAETLLITGWLLNDLSDFQQGMDSYLRAVEIHRTDGNKRELANGLIYLADGYSYLGVHDEALVALREALQIARTGGHRIVETLLRLKLGDTHLKLEQPQLALEQYLAALPMTGEDGYPVARPRALKGLGQAHTALGNYPRALEYLDQALDYQRRMKTVSGEADTVFAKGLVYQRMGQSPQAIDYFHQALSYYQKSDDRLSIARSLAAVARSKADQGQIAAAVERTDSALALLETLRVRLNSYTARATFFATIAQVYEQQIDLLMREPKANESNVRRAFNLSERARARSLLEMLYDSRALIETGVDASLLDSLRQAQQTLNDEAARRIRLEGSPAAKEELAQADSRLRDLTNRIDQIRSKIRLADPRYAGLAQPQPLTCDEVQKLLDADSLLLEFALGEQRSYLLAITPDSIHGYELPKRAELEKAANEFREALSRKATPQAAFLPKAEALSRMLFGAVASELGNKRLIIVAPEALQYVPFAALPKPQTAGVASKTLSAYQPLILNHEIVNLPSASIIAVLRRELGERPAASRQLAIFANPVFDAKDGRVNLAAKPNTKPALPALPALSAAAETSDLKRAVRGAGGRLIPLPSTQYEAEQILSLVKPPESGLKAIGFKATKSLATSRELGQFRIIHFATHGFLDNTHSELSGLVLSLVDEAGQRQDGYLRLHEIYNLRLNADLVVLSACQTGLGKEIRGEGLIGLTRGFMYAGAPRVVASLWQVNDASTAELMKRFYRGMLEKGSSPAAALRAAQIEMINKKENSSWQLPYAWGAFVFQGDWQSARK